MFKRKIFPIFLMIVMVVPVFASTAVNAAPPGCPAGTFTMMSKELESACKGEMAGKKVSVIGTQAGPDADSFQASFKEFEDWTGITVTYTDSKEVATAHSANPSWANRHRMAT